MIDIVVLHLNKVVASYIVLLLLVRTININSNVLVLHTS
jgi:hypothetical protein